MLYVESLIISYINSFLLNTLKVNGWGESGQLNIDIQNIKNTSEIFMGASNCYKKAFNLYREQGGNNLGKIVELLNKGADLENNVANIFINNA